MKIGLWLLIAIDIVAMGFIIRTRSFSMTMVLVMSLLLTNVVVTYLFRRIPSLRTDSSGHIVTLPHWASWTDYIPVLGGIICLLIGLFELTWQPCVIGAVAIAIGLWRIWVKGRMRQVLRDRR